VILGLLVGLPVSAGFLWLAVRNADLDAVRAVLADADRGLLAFGLLAIAVVYGLQAARWREISRARDVTSTRFFEMVVTGVACNNVLPARLGDLLRARWLASSAHMPLGKALGTVVIDRACDLMALLVLLVIGLAAVATSEWIWTIAAGTAIVLVALAAVVAFVRVYTDRHSRERRSRGVLRELARDTAEALAEPVGRRRPALWLAVSLGAWGTWSLAAIAVAQAVGFDLGFVDALFVAAVMNLGVAIPSSPGFVGTYEWLGVSALALLDVPSEHALAFAILLHACWYLPTTVGGGLALAVRGLARVRRTRAVAVR
jgi:glycosyltransferase 2 family protein